MTARSILGILGAAALPWPALAQPPNNSCANAPLLPLGGSIDGTTVGATVDGSSTCGLNTPDVWHRVNVPCGGDLTIYTCPASYDTVISLHSGCPGTSTNEIACNDDSGYCGAAYPNASAFTVHVGPGSYLVRVSGYSGATGTYTLHALLTGGGPANDNCASALPIGNGARSGDTTCASSDGSDACTGFGTPGPDLWYRYTAPCSGIFHAYTCPASFDTLISVHSGCPGTPGTTLACNDDSGYCGTAYPLTSHVAVQVISGEDYFIRVAGFNGARGTFTLNTTQDFGPPPNDFCAAATPAGDGPTPFGTCRATTDGPAEPASCNFYDDPQITADVWYRYTATSGGTISVSLCGADYDTELAIYGSVCPTAGGQVISCNDDSSCGRPSYAVFHAVRGQDYLIRVGGFQNRMGSGTMVISPCYANCDASTTPPILNVNDFACFLNAFAAGDPYANCDNSTSPPVLNVNDFACFLNKFAAGCT